MPETQKDELSLNKILAGALALVLASSGTTIGVQRVIAPKSTAVNQELIRTVKDLSVLVKKQYTDPLARPDAFTKSMANEKFDRFQTEHDKLVASDDRTNRAVQKLRDRLSDAESAVRVASVQAGLNSTRIDKVETSVTKHHEDEKGHAGIRRNTPIILDNQKKAHSHSLSERGR